MCKFLLLHFESVYFLQSYHSLSRLFGGFIKWKMSSNDELSSDTSSSCDVESLQEKAQLVSSVGRAPVCCAGGRWFEPQTGPTLRVLKIITEENVLPL